MSEDTVDQLVQAGFSDQVTDVYQHLYDLVYLRTHHLTSMFFPDPFLRRKEKAWQLHNMLLDVIEELNPGANASITSREWRRYQLMMLRYVDGLDPQAVSDHLAISRRHFYREHEIAIEGVCRVLQDRYAVIKSAARGFASSAGSNGEKERLELLRLEVARATQSERYGHVDDVMRGVAVLLQEMLRQRDLSFSLELPETLPRASIDRNLLRQLLLSTLGYLIENAEHATIRLTAAVRGEWIQLCATVSPQASVHATLEDSVNERLTGIDEIALLSGARILPIKVQHTIIGFYMQLPRISQRTILVVDDNEDIVELVKRYLSNSDYRAVGAQTAQDALALISQVQPYAITLDIMMPNQDGWDLMQFLLNQPETKHIPIIVCSVLKQKELALSLGATAFLGKPLVQQTLLSALDALSTA